jgi:hypothetical protein
MSPIAARLDVKSCTRGGSVRNISTRHTSECVNQCICCYVFSIYCFEVPIILVNFSTIRRIVSAYCSFYSSYPPRRSVTDAVLVAITMHLPRLTFLNLHKSSGYTINGALTLLRSFRHLQTFAVQPEHPVFTTLVLGSVGPSVAKLSDPNKQ